MEDKIIDTPYRKSYFASLKTIQSLREELHEAEQIIETYEILLDKDAMKSIEQSLREFKAGKGIPLSKLDVKSEDSE